MEPSIRDMFYPILDLFGMRMSRPQKGIASVDGIMSLRRSGLFGTRNIILLEGT
jgi:hypothetical protein